MYWIGKRVCRLVNCKVLYKNYFVISVCLPTSLPDAFGRRVSGAITCPT